MTLGRLLAVMPISAMFKMPVRKNTLAYFCRSVCGAEKIFIKSIRAVHRKRGGRKELKTNDKNHDKTLKIRWLLLKVTHLESAN